MQKISKALSVIKFVCLNILYAQALRNLSDGDYLIAENIPYQCQFASPELAADILEKKIGAETDPNWKDFGFADAAEYAYWSQRLCGIACLKMTLDFYGVAPGKTIAELTEECVNLGGYERKTDQGWFFKSLLLQARNYGFNGFVTSRFGVYSICKLILNKRFFIASVNPLLVRFDTLITDSKPGGHLALVIGFRMKGKNLAGFFLHNPSGKTEKTRKLAFVPIEIFKKAYAKRGIALWK